MAAQLELRMAHVLDTSGEIIDWHFTNAAESMREFNKLYNEYLGEAVTNVQLVDYWQADQNEN